MTNRETHTSARLPHVEAAMAFAYSRAPRDHGHALDEYCNDRGLAWGIDTFGDVRIAAR